MIIMDCEMPIMIGPEATQKLWELDYRGLILGYTAYVHPKDIEKCLESGMNFVLNRPSKSANLIRTVKKYIQ